MMRWFRIRKERTRKSPTGTYKDWKPVLADEGGHQCVYCALPDARFGGQYNFHVEHFHPKSKFPERVNDWANLFYCCAICNVFKGSDWTDSNGPVAYLDPAKVDYESVFARNQDGSLDGVSTNAKYMLEKIFLNRPQLLLERREVALRERLHRINAVLRELRPMLRPPYIDALRAITLLHAIHDARDRIEDLVERLRVTYPYAPADVRRS